MTQKKVAGHAQVNSQHKVTCRGTNRNHWIEISELSSEDTHNSCQRKTETLTKVEVVTKVKVCLLVFQNCPN